MDVIYSIRSVSARKKPISSNFIEKQANVWGKSVRRQGNIIKDDMKILFKACMIAEASRKPLFANLKILDLFSIYSLQVSSFMYLYHQDALPIAHSNLSNWKSDLSIFNKILDDFYLQPHTCRTNIKKFSVLFQCPRIRNALPNNIRNAPTFNISKRVIKPFLRVRQGTT